MKMITIAASLAIAALACITPRQGQAQSLTGDDAVLARYTLTVPKVKAWSAAGIDMAKAMQARSADQAEGEEMAETDANSIDDMVAMLDGIPEMRRAIRRAGLTSREYATISLVIVQVMMTESLLGTNPGTAVPKSVNRANLAFAKANRKLIQDTMAAMQAAGAEGQ